MHPPNDIDHSVILPKSTDKLNAYPLPQVEKQ